MMMVASTCERTTTFLGQVGQPYLGHVADISLCFEKTIKVLVDRLSAIDERVAKIETRTNEQIGEIHTKINTLAHNIQGFGDSAEKLEAEKAELENYKMKLRQQEDQRRRSVAEKKKVYDKPPSNEDARQRWKWAFSQIKFNIMMGRLDLKGMKVNMQRSIGHRLEKVEDSIDCVLFKMENMGAAMNNGGGTEVRDSVRFLDHKLEALMQKVAAYEERATEHENWREQQDDAMQQVSCALEEMSRQVAVLKEHDDSEREQAESGARELESVYATAVSKLRDLGLDARHALGTAPVSGSTLAPLLREFVSQLLGPPRGVVDNLDVLASKSMQERLSAIQRAAWALHKVKTLDARAFKRMQTDPDFARSYVSVNQVETRDGKLTFADDLATTYSQLLDIMRQFTNAGHVSLRTQWLEDIVGAFPEATTLEDRLSALAAEAETASRMAAAAMTREGVNETCTALIRVALDAQVAEPIANPLDISLNPQFQELVTRLGEAHATTAEIRARVDEKAAAADVSSLFNRISDQLMRIRATTFDRRHLEELLSLKADKTDIERIARELAANAADDDDAEPVLVSKEQLPKYKCLSCDRPLRRSFGLGASPPRKAASPAAFEALLPADVAPGNRQDQTKSSPHTTSSPALDTSPRPEGNVTSGTSRPHSAMSASQAEYQSRFERRPSTHTLRIPQLGMHARYPALVQQSKISAGTTCFLPSMRAGDRSR